MSMFKFFFLFTIVSFLSFSCKKNNESSAEKTTATNTTKSCLERFATNSEWSGETEVTITGYSASAMEPKISSDQVVLFWNDKPSSDDQMNIHYAVKVSGQYQYQGTVTGTVNSSALDGVPALDSLGNFYFVSHRNYNSTFASIFGGVINVTGPSTLQIDSLARADINSSAATNGIVDMDIDVSWDGQQMIVSRAQFSGADYPDSSHLELFDISSRQSSQRSDSSSLLANVNLDNCRVYAGTMSRDKLEIYFTVMPSGSIPSGDKFKIAVAKRATTSAPFSNPAIITAINGSYVEGPSLSYDDFSKTLFYHRLDSASGKFKIYKVTRP